MHHELNHYEAVYYSHAVQLTRRRRRRRRRHRFNRFVVVLDHNSFSKLRLRNFDD